MGNNEEIEKTVMSIIDQTTPRKIDDTDCDKDIHRPCYCAGRKECHDCGKPL